MPSDVEFMARERCRRAGYDPDMIVADADRERHFDYLEIGVIPVDIHNLRPCFMEFVEEVSAINREKELAS